MNKRLICAANRMVAWLDRDPEFLEESADYVMENGLDSKSFHNELVNELRDAVAEAIAQSQAAEIVRKIIDDEPVFLALKDDT